MIADRIRWLYIVFAIQLILPLVKISADELQITDYLGLIRAQRTITDKAQVQITVLRKKDVPLDIGYGNPLLVQRTGVAPDVEAVEVAPLTYQFNDVGAGIWRIRLRNKGLLLDRVEIIDHVH